MQLVHRHTSRKNTQAHKIKINLIKKKKTRSRKHKQKSFVFFFKETKPNLTKHDCNVQELQSITKKPNPRIFRIEEAEPENWVNIIIAEKTSQPRETDTQTEKPLKMPALTPRTCSENTRWSSIGTK